MGAQIISAKQWVALIKVSAEPDMKIGWANRPSEEPFYQLVRMHLSASGRMVRQSNALVKTIPVKIIGLDLAERCDRCLNINNVLSSQTNDCG